MSLTDMLGGLLGGGSQGQSGAGGAKMAAMAAVAAPLVIKFLQGGGLQKLMGGFQQKGMGDKAESWVAKGENKAITPQELEQVVGTNEIDQIAQKTGATREETEELLAKALPQVVDKVTPEGQVPEQAQVDQRLDQLLQQIQAQAPAQAPAQ